MLSDPRSELNGPGSNAADQKPSATKSKRETATTQHDKHMALNNAPDLTKQPPRSARVRLGGYVILPRMLDKGRATINGKEGEFHYNCPLDQHFVEFTGINPEALKEQLAAGKSDSEILSW